VKERSLGTRFLVLRFVISVGVSVSVALVALSCADNGAKQQPAPAATPQPSGQAPAPKAAEIAEPLLAWAEADPEDGKAPLRVQFNADIEGGTPPLKIQWTFGDGSTSSDASPVHTYGTAGSYRADLEVDDSAGDSDSDWVEIEVE
jgi:PKD repeat protein